jgi:regulation of enolase protein 1 (concanavalin A-like superfamily)
VSKFDSDGKTLNTDYQNVMKRLKEMVLQLVGPFPPGNPKANQQMWRLAYENIFLCEYYMRSVDDGTPDNDALQKLKTNTIALVMAQSRYGTFGADGSGLKENGSLHGTVPPYGPINSVGIPANLSIVLGKIALKKAGLTTSADVEINEAIARANNFFRYYVNKGIIPYGEQRARLTGHATNGKEQACAVMFALQGKASAADYFSCMSIASYLGREEGHCGTGFNYLWEGMGANVAGPRAVAKYLEQIQWSLDLERRSDGSFTYDGQRSASYAGSSTGAIAADSAIGQLEVPNGDYFGVSSYYGMNPTASHILTFSAPLKRLYITGKNRAAVIAPKSVASLTDKVVDDAIAAGSFQVNGLTGSVPEIIAKLGAYDPVVREAAAQELARRGAPKITGTQINGLVASITGNTVQNMNARLGACRVLGLLKTPGALPALNQRLADTDPWSHSVASEALVNFGSEAKTSVENMLNNYTRKAEADLKTTSVNDPAQINGAILSDSIFANQDDETRKTIGLFDIVGKGLHVPFYPALKMALKQPNSHARTRAAYFAYIYLNFDDTTALKSDLIQCANTTAQADTMFSMWSRVDAVKTLEKYKIPGGVDAAISLLEVTRAYDWGSQHLIKGGLDLLKSYGSAATPSLPRLRRMVESWPNSGIPQLVKIEHLKMLDEAIKFIELTTRSTTAFDKAPEGYTKCANENSTLRFDVETDVAFGAGGSFVYKPKQKGLVTFDLDFFKPDLDPYPGQQKFGYCKALSSTPIIQGPVTVDKMPEGYTFSGVEPSSIDLKVDTDVAFGVGNTFIIKTRQKGKVTFNAGFFGKDLTEGATKYGSYKVSAPSQGTQSPATVDKGPEGFIKFGPQDSSMILEQEADIAFGVGTTFILKTKQKGKITFSSHFFGFDLSKGVTKYGYYRYRSNNLMRLAVAQSVPANSALVTTAVGGLPLPWTVGGIGSGQLVGSSNYKAGIISQSGSGVLGITSDKLYFSYQTLSGDGEIATKISTMQDTGTRSGVGVMIRETLAVNSKHAFIGMTGSNAYLTVDRIMTGGISSSNFVGIGNIPNTWVKLVRVGNVITAFKSLDGRTWTTVGSNTVAMAKNCYIGLAVSSGSDAVLNNSQFTNLSVTP